MKFTEEVITKRWAPTIEFIPSNPHTYVNKAELYSRIRDCIIEIGQHTDTWVKVYVQKNMNDRHALEIFYGFHTAAVYKHGVPHDVENYGYIPKTAHNIATEVVRLVYGEG